MATKSKEIIKPYIKHDEDAASDGKISKMMFTFRRLASDMPVEIMKQFLPHAAYGIFWQILEFMYSNKFKSENIEIMSDKLRIPETYLKKILEDFELFEISDDEYISLRLLKDKEKRETVKSAASEAINVRWLLAEFNKSYQEFFETEPILKPDEIEALKNYSKTIPDLKQKLRDIIYTLKNLKFDTKTNFVPCANWLLKDKNLTRILNGEFGKLKHKPTEQELKAQELAYQNQIKENHKPTELKLKSSEINSRVDALDFIKEFYIDKCQKPVFVQGRLVLNPNIRNLAEKFNISDADILKLREVENG